MCFADYLADNLILRLSVPSSIPSFPPLKMAMTRVVLSNSARTRDTRVGRIFGGKARAFARLEW